MKNVIVLGLFAAAVVAIGGNKLRHSFSGLDHKTALVSVSERAPQSDFDWSGVVPAGKSIEIKGINGDIFAEYTDGNEVRVRAVKASHRSDTDDVRIQIVEHHGGVTICAVYPSGSSRERRNRCEPGEGGRLSNYDNDTEVEFMVSVPRGVGFKAHTVNGDVRAEGLTSVAMARTVNGDILLSTSGYGQAETVNGDIVASIGEIGEGLHFRSVNGDLVLTLPSGINAELVGNTVGGDISSDFSVSISGRFGPRSFSGILGDGGGRISLESVNGDIRIIRLGSEESGRSGSR